MSNHDGGPAIGRPWNKNAPGASGDVARLASLAAGGAVALFGLTRRSATGVALAALGGGLILRGVMRSPTHGLMESGQTAPGDLATPPAPATGGIAVEKTVTIGRGPEDLYQYWRNFENLPRFMKHLESVQVTGDRTSHWVAKAPAGKSVEWDAEIVEDTPNEQIGWRSTGETPRPTPARSPSAPPPATAGPKCASRSNISRPAAAGALLAKVFGEEPTQQVQDDLRRFKQIMETGEVVTTDGQPSGRDAR